MAGAAVEVSLIYGQDLVLQNNGDLQLSFDTYGTIAPEATIERLLRIILTNPITFDGNGNPVVPPDYLEHPKFGSGMRAAIEENFTPALVASINNRIMNSLQSYQYIIHQPPPTITWTNSSPGTYIVIINAVALTGQPFALKIQVNSHGAILL